MTDDEKYLFDLTGYLVIENALSPEEVALCNQAIDNRLAEDLAEFEEREASLSLAGRSTTMQGVSRRLALTGDSPLKWERPWCEPFRRQLAHPRVAPYLNVILQEPYRLDSGPSIMASDPGAEGHTLHGGGAERPNFAEAYFFKGGRIYSGMIVVEFLLADEGPGDGGFAAIPGSHKANLSCPQSMKLWEQYREHVVEVNAKAGDAIIFTETLTHGALPWKANYQRRLVLFKFSPSFLAYHAMAHATTPPDYFEDLTPDEQNVIQPPRYRNR